jgi:hypothetical protein
VILVDKSGYIPVKVWEPPNVGERLLDGIRDEIRLLSPREQNILLIRRTEEINLGWTCCK